MEKVEAIQLSPDRTFVVGLSTAIAVDDPNLTVQWSPGQLTNGEQSVDCPYNFVTGSIELIRSELHKRIDDIIDKLYGDENV